MRKTYFTLLIFMASGVISCVDNNYDLGNVNTDNITIGNDFVSPLGTVSINSENLLNLAGESDIISVVNNNIILAFKGTATFHTPQTKQASKHLIVVETPELAEIFGSQGANHLSLSDPRIKLSMKSDIMVPVPLIFYTASLKGEEIIEEIIINDINVDANQNNYWIGNTEKSVASGYIFREAGNISNLIAPVPTSIRLGFEMSSTLRNIATIDVGYDIEMPLAPKSDFVAAFTEKMTDIFDQQIIDAIFSSGSVSINAAVTNSFPFQFVTTLVVLDAENKEIGVDLGTDIAISCNADGSISTSELKFNITASDMEKMKNAKHLEVRLSAQGTKLTSGMNITDTQTLKLKLSIKKTGGINVG